MTTTSKMFVVCYGEYSHSPKILTESKGFRTKQQARQYAASLQQDPKIHHPSGDQGWIVVELETELD